MAPAASTSRSSQIEHEQKQQQCAGLLVVQPDGTTSGATCIGLRSAFRQGVDLAAWHAAERPGLPPGDLLLATCLGRSVFDSQKGSDGDAPPLCIGIEWLKYNHRAFHEQQLQGQERMEQLRQPSPAGSTAIAHAQVAQEAMQQQEQREQRQQESEGVHSVATPSSTAPTIWMDAALSKARHVADDVVEKYFGDDKDMLWFAKRFADRACVNASAMRRMAGQLAAAATGALPPEDADNEW